MHKRNIQVLNLFMTCSKRKQDWNETTDWGLMTQKYIQMCVCSFLNFCQQWVHFVTVVIVTVL